MKPAAIGGAAVIGAAAIFYAVSDGNRGGEGFSATWWPHIWRCKLEPITDSQEFDDILGRSEEDGTMGNIFSTFASVRCK